MKDVKEHHFFSAFIVVIGIVLLVNSISIDNAVKNTCASDKLRHSVRTMLVISVVFIVSGLAVVACCRGQKECTAFGSLAKESYLIFLLLLGVILVVLASIIKSEATKVQNCSVAGGHANMSLVLGIFMILIPGFIFASPMIMHHANKLRGATSGFSM
jgi:uncharacterized membrane protein